MDSENFWGFLNEVGSCWWKNLGFWGYTSNFSVFSFSMIRKHFNFSKKPFKFIQKTLQISRKFNTEQKKPKGRRKTLLLVIIFPNGWEKDIKWENRQIIVAIGPFFLIAYYFEWFPHTAQDCNWNSGFLRLSGLVR